MTDDFSTGAQLANEFGGVWTVVEDAKCPGLEYRAVFDNTNYANALGQWLTRYNVPHRLERVDASMPSGITITLLHALGALECADIVYDNFRKPSAERTVTVQSVLGRINPELGAARGK